jgi:hypothetical protein
MIEQPEDSQPSTSTMVGQVENEKFFSGPRMFFVKRATLEAAEYDT